ncbi:uncharacterized protein [Primulina eburnea]|uniref:uncharacterized protein n=1 Tax=Primulina eburnea TaxID=1245227 RepID=UPI003C6CBEAB
MDLLKYYDCKIQYQPGKVNVTADPLSRKVRDVVLTSVQISQVHEDIYTSGWNFIVNDEHITVAALQIEAELISRIKEAQKTDAQILKSIQLVLNGHKSGFEIVFDDSLRLNGRLVVPEKSDLRLELLDEAHCSRYSIHPGGKKMRLRFHMGYSGSSIKICTFIPYERTYTYSKMARLYIENIMRLHGIPVTIVSDRDPRFTSKIWGSFQEDISLKIGYEHCISPTD